MSDDYFESKAKQLLNELGEFLKLGELAFDEEDDTCTLVLDDTIEINITLHTEEEILVLHHLIGILPQENRQEVVEELLESNLFWSGTRGATLSIERSSGSVFIMRALTLYASDGEPLTGEALGNAIADLANASKDIKSLLVGESPEGASQEEGLPEKGNRESIDISKLS